jgi:hypothetical protein
MAIGDTRRAQRIALQVINLPVICFGNAGVSDQHVTSTSIYGAMRGLKESQVLLCSLYDQGIEIG